MAIGHAASKRRRIACRAGRYAASPRGASILAVLHGAPRIGINNMPKIILEGYIDVPDADLEAIRSELPTHIELTRKEQGCLVFRVEEDLSHENRFNVYEEFVSQEAFGAHQERAKRSRWGRITKSARREYSIRCL